MVDVIVILMKALLLTSLNVSHVKDIDGILQFLL